MAQMLEKGKKKTRRPPAAGADPHDGVHYPRKAMVGVNLQGLEDENSYSLCRAWKEAMPLSSRPRGEVSPS